MSNKLTDLTEATSIEGTDLLYAVIGGNSRKVQVSTLKAPITFSAHKGSTDQTGIVSGVATKVTFTTETFDIGSYYDAANSRWTPPAGQYQLNASILFNANVVDNTLYAIYIYRNGAIYREATVRASGTVAAGINISALVNASGSDFYEIYCLGLGAGDKTISGAFVASWFEGFSI